MTFCFRHSDSLSGCSAVGQPLIAGFGALRASELSDLGRGPAWFAGSVLFQGFYKLLDFILLSLFELTLSFMTAQDYK